MLRSVDCLTVIAYRDKKVVGVFVRFSCAANLQQLRDPAVILEFSIAEWFDVSPPKIHQKTHLKNKAATDNKKIEDSQKQ
jgi:hypothetical protein